MKSPLSQSFTNTSFSFRSAGVDRFRLLWKGWSVKVLSLMVVVKMLLIKTSDLLLFFFDSLMVFFSGEKECDKMNYSSPKSPFLKVARFVFLLLSVCSVSWGQNLLINEDFTGLTTSSNLAGQGSWTKGGSGPDVTVSNSTSLTYSGYNGGGGNYVSIPSGNVTTSRVYRGFTATTAIGNSFYVSVLLRLSAVTSTGDYFISLGDAAAGTTYAAKIWAKSSGSGFVIGLSKTSSTANYGSTVLNLNQTYLVIMRYSGVTGTSNDLNYLWVNPSMASEPVTGSAECSDNIGSDPGWAAGNVGNFHWHNRSVSNPTGVFDAIRIATASTSASAWTSLAAAVTTTNYYWNGSNNTSLSGTWNTSTTNFTTPTATATPNAAWIDGSSNVANFLNTSGGTITIPANRTYSQVNITNTSGNAHIFSTTNGGASGYQLGGPIALTSSSVLQMPVDNSITNDATLDLMGNVTGASGSSVTLRSNVATSSNSSRLNLAATGITFSVPTVNITGAGNGLAGFVSTGGFSTTLSSNIVNNSSSITTMLGVSGASTLTYSGILSGNKNLQFSAGTSGGTGTIVLSGANNYSGGNTYFNLSNDGTGIVRLGATNTLPTTTNLVFASTTGNGGSLQLYGFNQTVGSISQVDLAGSDVIANGVASTASTLTLTQATSNSISIPFTNGGTGTLAVVKNGAGTLTASGVGANYAFTGGLTIGAGEWRWNPITSHVSVAVPVTLNGGTLSTTSIAASRNVTLGTLNLAASSTLALGGGSTNTLTFAASNGVSWTGSTTLTISGWTGTAIDGTGGVNTTGPKLFIGTLATHLTATQLSQIQFSISGNNYSAVLLSTGELVPTTATKLAFTLVPTTAIPGANFSVTVQSQDANNNPAIVNSETGITISGNYVSGTAGSFTGNTGTIAINTNSVSIGTLSYSTAAVITVTAARSSGQTLTNGTSSNITIASVTTATDYFRSNVATGNWGTAGSWQSSPDNSSWITATLVPTNSSAGITIQNGHTITVASAATAKTITINNGGAITLSSSLTISTGSGTTLQVNGTLNMALGGSLSNANTTAFSATGIYNHQINGGTVPTATWDAASTCNITGNTSGGTASTINIAQTFGNFNWNCTQSGSNYLNVQNSSFALKGTFTMNSGLFSFGNAAGTYSNTINSLVVNGGTLGFVANSVNETLTITNDLTLTGGLLRGVSGSGTINLTIGRDLLVQGGTFNVIDATSNSATASFTITRDLNISGSGSININNNTSTTAGILNVGRDFISTGTNVAASGSGGVIDFGAYVTATTAIYVARNFSKSGVGTFVTSGSTLNLGFVFNGGGASQTLSYSGANSLYTSYQVSANSNLQLLTNLTLGTGTIPASYFTVNGSLDFQTFSIIAGNTTEPRFITASGATLITSNTAGLGGTGASGSLQGFGSVLVTAGSGVAQLIAGVNYKFNGATTTPFPSLGTIGNPANITINAAVTANSAITSTGNFTIQSGSYDVTSANNYALNITGNFTNNGTFTPRSGTVTFNGNNALQTISGAAITTPFNNITVNKGTSNANILNVTSVITLASGGLTITNGTFKLSSASTITPFSSSGTIPSTGGLWNNGGTISAGSASVTVYGIFRASDGTINIGSNLIGASTTTYTIDGGTVNVVGRFLNSGGSYTMSSGNLTLGTTAPNVNGNATFEHSLTSNINISGGTITIQNANANTGGDLLITNSSGTKSITGGTIVFGNGSTPNSTNFKCNASGAGSAGLFNVTLGATNSPTVTLQANATVSGLFTLTSGATLADGGNTLSLAGNIAGTGTHNGAGKITMTSSGATISGATLQNLELSNAGGFSLTGSPTINGALTLTNGKLTIGANTLSLAGTVASMSATNSLVGSASSILSVSGAGALGSLFFDQTTDGTTNKLSSFTINRTTSGTLTLGNKLVVTGLTTITAGNVNVTYVNGIASTAFTPTTQSVTFSSATPTNGTYQLFNGPVSVSTSSFSSTNTPNKDVTFNFTTGVVSVSDAVSLTTSNTSGGTFDQIGTQNIIRSTSNVVSRTILTVANGTGTLSSFAFTTPASGSNYTQNDIGDFKLYYSPSANGTTFASASPTLLGTVTSTKNGTGITETITFNSLSQSLSVGTYYLWVKADVKVGATASNTLIVGAPTITASVGTATNGISAIGTGTQTIIAGAATNVYFKASPGSSSPTDAGNWSLNSNGSSGNDFTGAIGDADINWNIRNSNVIQTSNWTLGNNSKVILGDGTNANSFTINSGILTGTVDVSNAATLNLNSTSIPTLGTLGTTSSTVSYGASGDQTIADKTYANLSISGSGVKTVGTSTVTGTLTRSGSATIGGVSPNLTGATMVYLDASNSLTYTAGLEWPSTNGPNNVTVNLSGTGSPSLTLSGDRTVSGTLALTAGKLTVGANTLTIAGTVSRTSGTIDADAGTVSFTNATANDLSLPTSLFSGNIYNLSKPSGAGTVTLNDNLTVTNELNNAETTGAFIIASSKELAVSGTGKATINGTITNNGTFTLNSGATLLQGSNSSIAGTGTFQVQQNVTGTSTGNFRSYYLGSPLNSVTSAVFAPETANNLLYKWDANTNLPNWSQISTNSTSINPGFGYLARFAQPTTLNFSGLGSNNVFFNNAPTSSPIQVPCYRQTSTSYQGFNLVSNPFPSYLDWNDVYTANSSFSSTIWYRIANGSNAMVFDTYNASGGASTNISGFDASRYIAPMQAFWVRIPSGGPSTANLSFSNSMREHYVSGVAGLRSSSQEFPAFLRLNLVQGNTLDQIILYMKPDASSAFDTYDSEKMFLAGTPQLYSKVLGKSLVINGMRNNKKKTSVPLSLDLPTTGLYFFQAEEYNIEDGLIILEDKQENIFQDLTLNNAYSFYQSSGTVNDRFVIHFHLPDASITTQGPSNIEFVDNDVQVEEASIEIASNGNGKVSVSLGIKEKPEGKVQVIDASGRIIFESILSDTETMFDLQTSAGIYYVKVSTSTTEELKKIVVQP